MSYICKSISGFIRRIAGNISIKQPRALVGAIVALAPLAGTPALAQYGVFFQTNIVSGVKSNWVDSSSNPNAGYVIGSNWVNDALLILNGGILSNGEGIVGYEGSNNAAIMSGIGSIWNNGSDLTVGYDGSGNTLTITNGGAAYCLNGHVGYSDGSFNMALVTGSGSIWNNTGSLSVGSDDGGGNALVISGGGQVYDTEGHLGVFGGGNWVWVTGSGSVWSNQNGLTIDDVGGSSLIISNQGAVYDDHALLQGDEHESVLVTGIGSVWNTTGEIRIEAAEDSLTISSGGAVYCDGAQLNDNTAALVTGTGSVWSLGDNLDLFAGSAMITNGGAIFAPTVSSDSSRITVAGGGLYVTNGLGTGGFTGNDGALALNGGTVTVDQLLLTDTSFAFTGGWLNSAGTFVTNGENFAVGDGTNGAAFQMVGGFHSFADGLLISSNASLSGCGTIDGSVAVNPGGAILANCGGMMTFTSIATNNGSIYVTGGSTLSFYGPVVNNGLIDASQGHLQFLSGVQNNGTIVPDAASALRVSALTKEGNDIRVTWISEGGHTYTLQSTKAAAIAGYNTNFVDVSQTIVVSGTGLSATNYLDRGVAYAPVLPIPSGHSVTTSGAPSMVYVSAMNTRGIADSLGGALPIGSRLVLGTFSITEPTIQSNFFAGNLSAIMSNFTPYSTSFAVGDGTALPASWSVSRSAAGFGGRQIYLLAIDKPNFAAATHLGIFTDSSWIFPGAGNQIDIDLEDVTDFVIGQHGGPLTINLPLGGETYMFSDTARLSVLPGRILFYRVRLAQ